MSDHPNLAHHFSDPEQQRESAKLGMWIFLMTEILLFGVLLVVYAVYRSWHPETFIEAHKALNVWLGATNTVVLIVSSLTVALAVRSIQLNRIKACAMYLALTIGLAFVFLVIKYFEYSHKIHLGQLPGKFYTFTGIEGTNPQVFFSVYFLLTGLHAFHILIGISVLAWVMVLALKGKFSQEYYTPVELSGLYWHLVDVVWIFLFPLLYLVG